MFVGSLWLSEKNLQQDIGNQHYKLKLVVYNSTSNDKFGKIGQRRRNISVATIHTVHCSIDTLLKVLISFG